MFTAAVAGQTLFGWCLKIKEAHACKSHHFVIVCACTCALTCMCAYMPMLTCVCAYMRVCLHACVLTCERSDIPWCGFVLQFETYHN